MKKALAVIAAFGLLPTAVQAQNNDLRIDYSDLDLSQKGDVKKLEKRIAKAAARHCGANVAQTGSRVIPGANRECARQFEEEAMKQFAALIENERQGG